VILLVAAVLSHRPIRNLTALLTGLAIAYALIPDRYLERMSTLSDIRSDTSAMGRVENWALAWRQAVAHPVFGVGPENHIPYNLSLNPDVQVRVAHSVYFQVLGELGFPGLVLYLALYLLALRTLFKTWRTLKAVVRVHTDLVWARDLAFWMTCGLTGYLFGASLLNMFWIEFPWYAAFYGIILGSLVRLELAARSKGGGAAAAVPGDVLARGRLPRRPFVLVPPREVSQVSLVRPQRNSPAT
jgi:O-antigen ligase